MLPINNISYFWVCRGERERGRKEGEGKEREKGERGEKGERERRERGERGKERGKEREGEGVTVQTERWERRMWKKGMVFDI